MNLHYTYLLIDFLSIIVCFVFSFHQKIKFSRHFGAFILSALLVATPFIIWDAWFTSSGVWWFNHNYTIGWDVAGMPTEEWLFFICIPFACVFTYYCLDKFFQLNSLMPYNNWVAGVMLVLSLMAALLFHQHIYTFFTALLTFATVLFLYAVVKANWLAKASFIYLILMAGFLPVNGILTGTGLASPIVNYNHQEIINIRVLTIPIEDFFYGYNLFLLNIACFLFLQKRLSHQSSASLSTIDVKN